MCGIVYARRADGKAAQKMVLKRYTKQEDRGSEGFGYVAINKVGKISAYKRYMSEAGVRKGIAVQKEAHILFHHRFPTSTLNIPEAAHPILVQHKELQYAYYVVHNGVISNPDELRTDHVKLGYKYTTDLQTQYETVKGKIFYGELNYNDSEALAIEIARTIEALQPEVRARGSIAYIVLQVEKASQKLVATYYGTNGGNPLTIDRTNGLVIASEGGKAIVANVCTRIDAKDHTETPYPLPMPKPYVYQPPIGYHYTKYEPEEEDYMPEAITETEYYTDKKYTLTELISLRSELERNHAIANDLGEDDELLDIEMQLEDVNERIRARTEQYALDF